MLIVQKYYTPYEECDREWGDPIGFVRDFDSAYLWTKTEVNAKMKDFLTTAHELRQTFQLIETKEQYDYYENLHGFTYDIRNGKDKVHFPVFTPANASDESREFEIVYYIGYETSWTGGMEVLRWKFTKIDELPVVAVARKVHLVSDVPLGDSKPEQ